MGNIPHPAAQVQVRTCRDLDAEDARSYVDLVMAEAIQHAAIINPDPEGCAVTIEVRAVVECGGSRAEPSYRLRAHVVHGEWTRLSTLDAEPARIAAVA